MAKAASLRGERRKVVAVIGDGSMTGGLAFEGLNNAGADQSTDLLVILNDNHMAIDQATGALKNYLLKISTSGRYNRMKQRLWTALSRTPRLLHLCRMAGNAVKQGGCSTRATSSRVSISAISDPWTATTSGSWCGRSARCATSGGRSCCT